jgi:hypothetical protein
VDALDDFRAAVGKTGGAVHGQLQVRARESRV